MSEMDAESLKSRTHRRRRNGSLWFWGGIVLVVAGFAFLWPFFSGVGAETLSDQQFHPPSSLHPFGTDVHGRDMLVRLCHGIRISLMLGLAGAMVSLVIGVCWGAVAGYAGGRIDNWMMRFVDMLYSLPSIIFVMVLITTLEGLLKKKIGSRVDATWIRFVFLWVGLGAVSWLNMARIVRGQVLFLKQQAFVDATRTLGATPLRTLFRHIIPNTSGIVFTYAMLTVPTIILAESFLSFLGMGIQPPQASWGTLIGEGAGQINPIRIYWWLIVFPASTLVVTLMALNFLGDSLRALWEKR